jgi:hypothetical protein
VLVEQFDAIPLKFTSTVIVAVFCFQLTRFHTHFKQRASATTACLRSLLRADKGREIGKGSPGRGTRTQQHIASNHNQLFVERGMGTSSSLPAREACI